MAGKSVHPDVAETSGTVQPRVAPARRRRNRSAPGSFGNTVVKHPRAAGCEPNATNPCYQHPKGAPVELPEGRRNARLLSVPRGALPFSFF
jgi:hypothetical protein